MKNDAVIRKWLLANEKSYKKNVYGHPSEMENEDNLFCYSVDGKTPKFEIVDGVINFVFNETFNNLDFGDCNLADIPHPFGTGLDITRLSKNKLRNFKNLPTCGIIWLDSNPLDDLSDAEKEEVCNSIPSPVTGIRYVTNGVRNYVIDDDVYIRVSRELKLKELVYEN
jgi:hypothetical protein